MFIAWVLPLVTFLLITRKSGAPPLKAAVLYSKPKADSAAADKNDGTDGGATKAPPKSDAAKKSHPGIFYGSLSIFVLVSASAITFPFMQSRRDALGCDALCQGGQTSLRSALSLVGASLIGRLSDTIGRTPMLWVGLLATASSLGINATMDSLQGMWLALIPVSLLNQNFSVAKALFSDYIDEVGGTDADRAGAVGKLGMAVGFAFMVGPILATTIVSDYLRALQCSAVGLAISAIVLLFLPTPAPPASKSADATVASVAPTPPTPPVAAAADPAAAPPKPAEAAAPSTGLMAFLNMPVLQTRGAQLLMGVRLLMAFAFHMFMPIWQVSIKQRFNFAPKDHAALMGVIGLTYALSQGLVAKPMIRRTGSDPTRLLLLCIVVLGGARPFALFTQSVGVLYVMYVPMVIALGVMNTAITTACANLASGDQLGGLFGVLESVESVAGMVGPALGGLLSTKLDVPGTLGAVICCYGLAFVLVAGFFHKHVIAPAAASAKTKVA